MGVRNPFQITMHMTEKEFEKFEYTRNQCLSDLDRILSPSRTAAYFKDFDTLPSYEVNKFGNFIEVKLAGHSKGIWVDLLIEVCQEFTKSWVFFIATDDGECAQFFYSGVEHFVLDIPSFFKAEVYKDELISYTNEQCLPDSKIIGVEKYFGNEDVMTSELSRVDVDYTGYGIYS